MDLKKYIGSRIRRFRQSRNLTAEELATKLNTTRATITRYENGDRKANQDVLFQLAEIFNVSVDDFFPSRKNNNKEITNVIYPKGDSLRRVSIPIVGEIACGDPITAEENIEGYTEQVFTNNVPEGPLFALQCKGDSMEPTIPDGALAIIHEQPEVEDGEIAAVLVDDDCEATLKRIKHQGDLVMLVPDNKKYDPIVLDEKHPGHIVGKAIRYSANL